MNLKGNKRVLKTGVQEAAYFHPSIDIGYDFVMVYGFNALENRMKSFSTEGYHISFMVGIAWGEYQDYLDGTYDGIKHLDDIQMDKNGEYIMHDPKTPYMSPSIPFANYLIHKLKKVVDLGIDEIYLEEPEYWSHAGYELNFKREFEIHYQKPWVDPKNSAQLLYEVSSLKAKLFKRLIEQVTQSIKDYGMRTYQRMIKVFIPTHSLLNYTQWKIISPEGILTHIDLLDGFIAQVWTGTSREANTYKGVTKERTFETAYLEYGIMQALTFNSNKKMWFLADPIEDNPKYTWENYQYNYEQTLVASLLHPSINEYEVAPWPNRIFNRKLPDIKQITDYTPKYIPSEYDVYLNNVFQMLHMMPKGEVKYEGFDYKIGLSLADSALYQRNYGTLNIDNKEHIESLTFPDYYGLSLPLLKQGIPIQGFSLDRSLDLNYLDQFDGIILSYDFLKPYSEAINHTLKAFIENKKFVIYVGDGNDVFNQINGWWKNDYKSPVEHLLNILQVKDESGIYAVGKGYFGYLKVRPEKLTSLTYEKEYISLVTEVFHKLELKHNIKNYIHLKRKPYQVIGSMDEVNTNNLILHGQYIDMLSLNNEVKTKIEIKPNTYHVYYDLEHAKVFDVIKTSYRIVDIKHQPNKVIYKIMGKQNINGMIVVCVDNFKDIKTDATLISKTYNKEFKLLEILISFKQKEHEIEISYE